MEVTLEITSGALAGEKFPIQHGLKLRIGRGANADIAVAADPLLSELHFAFWWDEKGCRIQNLQSANGTFLNGQNINEAAVRNGDKIVAGHTHFVVRVKRDPGVVAVAQPSQPRGLSIANPRGRSTAESLPPLTQSGQVRDLGDVLREQLLPLFAILDAARDTKVLETLRNCDQPYQSLYEGVKGELLAEFAPYLVELSPRSILFETLTRQAWGKSWGIFLTSSVGFKETRRHFRHFLLVQTEDGRELYFRFYDPRVLRVFLPTCTPQETKEFFGPLGCFLVEAEEPTYLIQFTQTRGGVTRKTVALAVLNTATISAP